MKDAEFTRCGECKAFREWSEVSIIAGKRTGRCHRRPPTFSCPTTVAFGSNVGVGEWPLVMETDGCFDGIPRAT